MRALCELLGSFLILYFAFFGIKTKLCNMFAQRVRDNDMRAHYYDTTATRKD